MDYTPLIVIGGSLIRSLTGWAKSSFRDGQINILEWKLLAETIVRVGLLSLIVVYFPWIDVTAFEATAIAIAGDVLLMALKKFRPQLISDE